MLTWTHPWALLFLPVVAAVAAWTLWRPNRQQATVATLSLWRVARQSLSASARQRSRRVSLWWLILLIGAVSAVLAAAAPAIRTDRPSRRIALRIRAGAELGSAGMAELRASAAVLLGRLESSDRVALLTPVARPIGEEWMSPAETTSALAEIEALPIAADELTLPPPPADAQQTITFAPSGSDAEATGDGTILLATDLPAVTFEAIGAADLPGGKTQIFLAVRNHTDQPRQERVWLDGLHAGGRPKWGRRQPVLVPANGRESLVIEVNESAAVIQARIKAERPYDSAQLVRRDRPARPVAMLGPDRRAVRRFVEADPMLQLVADPNQADAVLCIATDPPAGKPALVLAPPMAPEGWRQGGAIGPTTLGETDVAADDPVMRNVNLAGLAVRRVRPWVPTGDTQQVRLVLLEGEAIALRSSDGVWPRRVWIAVDPSAENTDLAVHYPMLVWLHNAMRFVLDESGRSGKTLYESRSASLGHPGWVPVSGGTKPSVGVLGPGVYSAGFEEPRAVNLLGLRSGRPKVDPVVRAGKIALPSPTSVAGPVEFRGILTVLAGGCWLVGWWLRSRSGRVVPAAAGR